MKRSHEEKSWRRVIIESHNRISIYLSSCLDESSWKFWVNTWFQLSDLTWILELNILTWLKYLSQEFWLESSLDELKTRLNLNDLTQCNQSRIDYDEIFTSMIKVMIIKMLLALMIKYDYKVE